MIESSSAQSSTAAGSLATPRTIAFVYAGQGSQTAGMGCDLYKEYPAFRAALECMDPTGDIRRLCFEASIEELSDTRNTQPAMVAFELALTVLVREEGVEPALIAGLSLGEYAALAAAGVFDDRQAVDLVAYRGKVMANAVAGRACGMVAVLGLEGDAVRAICREATEAGEGIVESANFNCPGQVVISGDAAAVDRAAALALAFGAKRCMNLPVSGPFHTSLMKPAGDALRVRFAEERFGAMRVPVVFNVIGREKKDSEQIPELLERQVQSSVLFDEGIRAMVKKGVDTIIEIGPGRTLSKLIRKIDRSIEVLNVGDRVSFVKTIQSLKENEHDGTR